MFLSKKWVSVVRKCESDPFAAGTVGIASFITLVAVLASGLPFRSLLGVMESVGILCVVGAITVSLVSVYRFVHLVVARRELYGTLRRETDSDKFLAEKILLGFDEVLHVRRRGDRYFVTARRGEDRIVVVANSSGMRMKTNKVGYVTYPIIIGGELIDFDERCEVLSAASFPKGTQQTRMIKQLSRQMS